MNQLAARHRRRSVSTAPSVADLEACRPTLLRLCYRMLGSMVDAEDAVQDSILRGWRGLSTFQGRSSLSTWLCRIAVRVCLDQRDRQARTLPPLLQEAGTTLDALDPREAGLWLEPAAGRWLHDPESTLLTRDEISLAWVTALQQLPPTQRAALLLREVVGLSAAETAQTLDTTPQAVNSALQRARATLDRGPDRAATSPDLPANREAVERFAEAFERYDLDALAAMLREDTTMCMPPLALWLRGGADIVAWMGGRGAACRGSRLVRTVSNGAPAWGQYKPEAPGLWLPWAIVAPVARHGEVSALHFFLDTAALFPRFGLPDRLTEADGPAS